MICIIRFVIIKFVIYRPDSATSYNTKADRKTGPPSTVYTTEIPIRYSVTSDLTARSASSNLLLANERMNSAEG